MRIGPCDRDLPGDPRADLARMSAADVEGSPFRKRPLDRSAASGQVQTV